eukprot:PITA_11817
MALVTTSSLSILVNNSPSEIFIPPIGLKLGELHSPFLFILMMEGLGQSIKHAKAMGKIKGLELTKNCQALTHQQFVHDTMLQGIPTVKEASTYNQILNRNISSILGFQKDSFPSKYLGVPLMAKPMLKRFWEPVLNMLQDKVKKWTIRALNLAGRLVLTKDVLQSIPVFMLSALPAPKGVLDQFRNIQRDFLWGKEEVRKKWALVS